MLPSRGLGCPSGDNSHLMLPTFILSVTYDGYPMSTRWLHEDVTKSYCLLNTIRQIRLFFLVFLSMHVCHRVILRLANRGRLLLRTPGPVPFWTFICSKCWDHSFFPELVMSTDLLSFEHPSVLLFCFITHRDRSGCLLSFRQIVTSCEMGKFPICVSIAGRSRIVWRGHNKWQLHS